MRKPSVRITSSHHPSGKLSESGHQVIRSSGHQVIITAALALGLLAAALAPVWAGGPYEVSSTGEPMRWNQNAAVRFALDQGAFGSRSHAWAAATVDQALHLWGETPGSHLQIEMAKELPRDINGDNVEDFL